MSTSVQELGLKNIQVNGILLGATQSLGYLLVFPFTHKMRRRKWSIVFQVGLLISIVCLFAISFLKKTKFVLWTETFFSTFFISTITSALFPLLFLFTSELFPTKIRGLANALVLFFGKLVGTLTPFVVQYCEKKDIHILVGCGALVFISLPATYLLEETLVEEGEGNIDPGYKVIKRVKPLDLKVSNDDYIRDYTRDSQDFDLDAGEMDADLIF